MAKSKTKIVKLELEVPVKTCTLLISAVDANGNEIGNFPLQIRMCRTKGKIIRVK